MNMKKINLLILILFVSFSSSFTQINEEVRSMTQGLQNALIINIPNVQDKLVEKIWKNYIKTKDAKTKKIRKSEEWIAEGINIPGIGTSSTVDVYATFEQVGEDVRMIAWFDVGAGYLSSEQHPDSYGAGEEFLNAFELEVYREGIKSEIAAEESVMKKLETDLNKLQKANERLLRDIEIAKKKIANAEADIIDNQDLQKETTLKIEAQKSVLENKRKQLDVRED